MGTVFAHSDDMVVSLLVKWLDIVDVIQLDTACSSSRSSRDYLCRIFTLPQVMFHNVHRMSNCFDPAVYFHWLLRRMVKLVEVVITPEMDAYSKQLVEQYINMCGSAVRHLHFSFFDNKVMFAAMKNCFSLRRLSINGGADIEKDSMLYSESVETFYLCNDDDNMNDNICINFPNLTDLTLIGSYINDEVLINAVQHSPKLQNLKLAEAQTLTAASYAAIGQYCKCLERFTVNEMTISSTLLASILPCTPQLKELTLCPANGEVDEQVVFETVACHCQNITELTLGFSDAAPRGGILKAFTTMLSNCTRLHTILLGSCTFVTDDYLLVIASKATQIANIHLPDCKISNAGLAQVAKHCTKLELVSFSVGGEYTATNDCIRLFRKDTKVRIIDTDDLYGNSGGVSVSAGGGGVEVVANEKVISSSTEYVE